MFMDAAVGWVLDVRLSAQETCAMLSYFLPRDWWLLRFCFWTHPLNLNLLRSRTPLTGGSKCQTHWTINVCYLDLFSFPWLLATWLLFLNPSLKFQIDKVEGRCWRVGPGCQIIWKGNVYYVWFILFPVIAAYLTFIFEPAREIWTWEGWWKLLTGGSRMSDYLKM
jgi:hypothetical protein